MSRQAGPGRPKGQPKTGGRKKGIPDKLLKEKEIAKIKLSGAMPLDYLLNVMRDPDKDEKLRLEAAKGAAPYCHSRLEAVDPNQKPNDPYAGKTTAELNAMFMAELAKRGLMLIDIPEDPPVPEGIAPPRGSNGSGNGSEH